MHILYLIELYDRKWTLFRWKKNTFLNKFLVGTCQSHWGPPGKSCWRQVHPKIRSGKSMKHPLPRQSCLAHPSHPRALGPRRPRRANASREPRLHNQHATMPTLTQHRTHIYTRSAAHSQGDSLRSPYPRPWPGRKQRGERQKER